MRTGHRNRGRWFTAFAVASLTLLLGRRLAGSAQLRHRRCCCEASYQCVGSETELFNNSNGDEVENGGTEPSFSTDGRAYCLISISTYHWNDGNGETPGTIGLLSEEGSLGPWDATGSTGQATDMYPDGVPNASWTVTPTSTEPVVIDGDYACDDSDPATWSQNAASDEEGFCEVWVKDAEQTTTTTGTTETTTTTTTPTTTTTTTTGSSSRPRASGRTTRTTYCIRRRSPTTCGSTDPDRPPRCSTWW
jgi:hypothetical protein